METASSLAVLLLGLPQSALAGIDLLSFTVTPRFHGVKDLPPGFHFIFAGSTSAFSVRHGLWFHVSPKRSPAPHLFITRWRTDTETLAAETDPAETLRWRANIGEFWREGLTPYRQTPSKDATAPDREASGDWPLLASRVTPALLSRITQGDERSWGLTSASSARADLDEIPGLGAGKHAASPPAEKELRFLPVDLRRTWRAGATGRERTDAAQDRSWALGELIEQSCSGGRADEVVGELQFCFLMTLTLNNWSCFEQWKRLLALLLTCRAAVATRPELFVDAIAALRLQLQHCRDAEGGLIDMADEGGSLLKDLLVRFRKGIEEVQAVVGVRDVVDELDDLEALLKEEYGWQFGGSFVKSGVLELEDGERVRMDTTAFDEDDETGEYAPQIVDLTPEQARLLNVAPDSADLLSSMKKTSLREVAYDSEDEDVDSQDEDVQYVDGDREDEDMKEEKLGVLENMSERF